MKTFMSQSTRMLQSVTRASAILLIGVLGCNEGKIPTYPAHGKVTYPDGTPLQGGRVEFEAINSPRPLSARAEIDSDGSFQLGTFRKGDGVPAGEYRAIVMPPLPPGDLEEMKYVPAIDQRYQQYETSGLKFTVSSSGANEFQIEVAKPGQ